MKNLWLEISSLKKCLGHSVSFFDGQGRYLIGIVTTIFLEAGTLKLVVECSDGTRWEGVPSIFGL